MSTGQTAFTFKTWGGRREGAGRKRTRERAGIPHRARDELRPHQPVHVTVRMAPWVWNLRSQRSFAIIAGALGEVRGREDVRFVEYSIQGNHIHAIVEASSRRALSGGMRALSIRISQRLNAMMGRRGRVLEDRHHVHVLKTPAEVRGGSVFVARRDGAAGRTGLVVGGAGHASGGDVVTARRDPATVGCPRVERTALIS